ncbi:hypothetical protein M3Y99_00988800 [Aphelenchoides fujianensis]|nr:hypothetical protein M3Y99_00988800 [Aphelenchoides fujianensis]
MRGKQLLFHPPCAVCEQQKSSGFHFGVLSCRSRRALAENRRYICYRNQQCDITNNRNFCRACRLSKAIAVGMHFEKDETGDGRADESPRFTATIALNDEGCYGQAERQHSTEEYSSDSPQHGQRYPSAVHPLLPCSQSLENYPTLSKLTADYRRFIAIQEDLFRREFPQEAAAGIRCIQVSKNEWLQLEKRTYPFIYAFFDRYEPMSEVEKEDRVKLIEKHWQRVRSFHRSFLTYREWPNVEDRRVMLNAGIFMDLGDLRAYLKEVATQQQIDSYINDATCSHVFKTGEKFFRKVKQMRIRDVDVAALMSLIFWLDAEQQMNITSPRIVEYQERVMAEWVANLIASYGETEANKRLAKMLYIRLDLEAMAVVMKNASLLTDLLWPKDEKHLLREMSTERPAYLEILRRTADATTFPTPRSLLSFL